MPRLSPQQTCRRAFPCSPPFIATRNAYPRYVGSIRRAPSRRPGLSVRPGEGFRTPSIAGRASGHGAGKGLKGRRSIKPSGMENATGLKRGGKRVKPRRRGKVTSGVVPETEMLRVAIRRGRSHDFLCKFRFGTPNCTPRNSGLLIFARPETSRYRRGCHQETQAQASTQAAEDKYWVTWVHVVAIAERDSRPPCERST